MCTVKRAKKERELLQRARGEESQSQEGSLEKRARIAPWKLPRRLRSVSDQKSPRFSRVNKLLFQIRTKYSQGIFISRKYICITTKERARETCPKHWNSCVDTSGHLVWCDKHKMFPTDLPLPLLHPASPHGACVNSIQGKQNVKGVETEE